MCPEDNIRLMVGKQTVGNKDLRVKFANYCVSLSR